MTQIMVLEYLPLEGSEALPRNHLRNSGVAPVCRGRNGALWPSPPVTAYPAEAPNQRLEWGARGVIVEVSRLFPKSLSFKNTFGMTHVLVLENVTSTDRTLTRDP